MSSLEHTDLNVDADSLLDETSLLIEASGFRPLLHLLANASDLDDQVLVCELLSDLHATGHASHLDGCAGNTSIALSVVLLDVDARVAHVR